MRMIDADKLVEAMTGACNIQEAQGMNTISGRTLITIAREAPTESGWVNVKDKLPDYSCAVLVFHEFGSMQVLDYSRKHKAFNCYDWNSETEVKLFALEDVTHWMPLPAPPQEGKQP